MRNILFLLLLVAAVPAGKAQDAVMAPNPYMSTPSSPSADYPSTGYPSTGSPSTGSPSAPTPLPNTRADHLRDAAQYLYLAGLNEEAQKYWQKEAEERAHPTPLVSTKLRVLELSRNKLGRLSSKAYGGDPNLSVTGLLAKAS